jgi:ADP-ribose pyrophosphatase
MQLPKGVRMDGELLIYPDSVCALHVNAAREILLVRQERPTYRHETLELPGGKVREGESPTHAALRELSEESGYSGQDAAELITLDLDLSVSVHRTHLVRVHRVFPTRESSEFNLAWLSLEQAYAQVMSGHITHAPTVAGVLFIGQPERAHE